MLCSVYTTIAGEYCDPPFCTPIGKRRYSIITAGSLFIIIININVEKETEIQHNAMLIVIIP